MKIIIEDILLALLKVGYFAFGIDFVVKSLMFYASARVLSMFGAKVGKDVRIYTPLYIHNAEKDFSNLRIGNNVHIGRAVLIDLRDDVEIGNNVTISMKSNLITHFDVGEGPLKRFFPAKHNKVAIGSGVYIGIGSTILHGVKIGKNCLIGACSLVNFDVEENRLVQGLPKTGNSPIRYKNS